MKPAVFCTLAATAIMMASTVDAHGQMLVPSYRPITAKYRQDCLFGLKGAGDDELQWAPIENLSQRGQADQPVAKTFNIYNGCRGLVYESRNNVTALTAGKSFEVQYFIQATHPGYMKLSIVKPSTDSDGTITYKADTQIGSFSDFANTAGTFSVSATIPTTVTGCETAGDCALQFYWHSDIANQSYPTCADITISGSGASSPTSKATTVVASSTSSSSSGATTQTTSAPKATTATPTAATSKTTDSSGVAGEASYTADSTEASADATSTDASADTTQASGDGSTTSATTDAPTATDAPTTDAPTTDAPEVTSAPATTTSSADSSKCSVRRIRRTRQ